MAEQITEEGDVVCLTEEKLLEQDYIDACRANAAGAICSFAGTTRDYFQGKEVTRLEYEAYIPLAIKTLAAISREARSLASQGSLSSPSTTANLPDLPLATTSSPRDLTRIVIVHRLGVVPPSETSIVIVVSCGHRRESFAACEWILEAVKKKAEVWKREVYAEEEQDKGVWKANFPS